MSVTVNEIEPELVGPNDVMPYPYDPYADAARGAAKSQSSDAALSVARSRRISES
jgi:hypothetical protein